MSKLDDILTGFPFQGGGTKVWEYNDYGKLVKPQIKQLVLDLIAKENDAHPEFCRVTGEQFRECLQCVLERIKRSVEAL